MELAARITVSDMRTLYKKKDFWAGTLFLVFGAAFVVISADYRIGTASKMGPGYFPVLLGASLILIGIIIIAGQIIRPGACLEKFSMKPLALVTLATSAFGALVSGAGLVIAVVATVLLGARASEKFSWRTSLLLAAGLAIMSWLVFSLGLGLPVPAIGNLLGG